MCVAFYLCFIATLTRKMKPLSLYSGTTIRLRHRFAAFNTPAHASLDFCVFSRSGCCSHKTSAVFFFFLFVFWPHIHLCVFRSIYMDFTCNIWYLCVSRGSSAHCFYTNSSRIGEKNLTYMCQFLAIALVTSHSFGLLLSSSFSLTLQSYGREHSLCVCVCACVYMPACMCLCVYVCAYMCQKLGMILSPVKALDHPAQLTPDLTVQLN